MLGHINISRREFNFKLPSLAIIAVVMLVGSMLMERQIPELFLVRAIVAMVFLLILPGYMALKVLGIQSKSPMEQTVMVLGLSIALIMFLGVCANFILPCVGVNDPLSIGPLTALMSAAVAVLSVAAAFRSQGPLFHFPKLDLKIKPYHLLLVLVPIVTLLGVAIQNNHSSNIGLIISLSLVCVAGGLAGFGKIPEKAYPATIFVMSFCLLMHTSLISDFLWGWDVFWEYRSANMVVSGSFWDPSSAAMEPMGARNVDAMLSIVVLGPTISMLSGINMEVVFRIVYPVIFSLAQVGFYIFFKKQTNEKIAFLSSFLIISFTVFFLEMPQLARQEIAELFVALLLLLMIDTEIERPHKTLLFILFSLSLVVSHYGTYYFFIAIFLTGFILETAIRRWKANDKWTIDPQGSGEGKGGKVFYPSSKIILLILLASLAWYTFASDSSPLLTIINVINSMLGSILDGGANIIGGSPGTPMEWGWMISLVAFAIFVIIGGFFILKKMKNRINAPLATLNLAAFGVLSMCLILPNLASSLNASRVYHLALLFLAPCVIIGMKMVIEKASAFVQKGSQGRHSLKVISVIVVLSLAYHAGLVHELTSTSSTSIALGDERDFPQFTTGEVVGAKWAVEFGPGYYLVDDYRRQLFNGFIPFGPMTTPAPGDYTPQISLFYFGKYNLDHHELYIKLERISWEDRGIYEWQNQTSKVYTSEYSELWYLKVS